MLDKVKSLNGFNNFELILFGLITLVMDYLLWFIPGRHMFKGTVLAILGFMFCLCVSSFLSVLRPLLQISALVDDQIVPLFFGVYGSTERAQAKSYETLFNEGTAKTYENSLICFVICLCLLVVRASTILIYQNTHIH